MSTDKLNLNTFSSLALQKDREQKGREQSATFGLGLMSSLNSGSSPNPQSETSAVLVRLSQLVAEKKNLTAAYGTLSAAEQGELRKQVGAKNVDEILAISLNPNAEVFWQEALAFGVRLKDKNQVGGAGGVLGAIAQAGDAVPASLRQQASRELDSILGKGSTGLRTEFLVGQFTEQATDWRVIAPMIAGSAVYSLARTTALSRLAGLGRGAKLGSSAMGMAFEVPVFALGTRALARHSDPRRSVADDLWGATLTLGALKMFGAGGQAAWKRAHGFSEAGVATRMAGSANLSRGVFTQGSMFLGLMASHRLEQAVGLRPKVDGATAVTDTLSSMVALGVGANLGHRILGPGFTRFQAEVESRAQAISEGLNRPAGDPTRPIPWLASIMQGKEGGGSLVPVAAGGGRLPIGVIRPLLPAKGGNVSMMVASGDEGGKPPAGLASTGGPGGEPKSPPPLTWLTLSHDKVTHSLRVTEAFLPEAQRLWAQRSAEVGETELTTVAAFLKTILEAKTGTDLSEDARTALLGDTFLHFHQTFVKDNDIHAVTRGLNNQGEILTSYNRAKDSLRFVHSSKSALLVAAEAGKAGLFAQFGGQANSYFQELSNIYQAYPEIRELVIDVGAELKAQAEAPEAQALGFHPEGLDVVRWLENPQELPDAKYQSSSAVSQPLILLTQIAHYYNTLRITGKTPGQMRELLKGTTGHSQGVMSSVVIAASATEAELFANAKKAATYLLWQGIRMQQASPEATLNPDIVAESV